MKKFDVERFKNPRVQDRLRQALEYKRDIDAYISQQSGSVASSLRQAAMNADTWVEMIFNLAQAIENYEGNASIDRDRKALPTTIADLKARLTTESDPGKRAKIQTDLASYEQLLQNMKSIEAKVSQADGMIDSTLAQLRKVHQTLQSRPGLN
jgi:hypothetical protein